MSTESFESMLTGGHPNSLGRTLEVVKIILKDKAKLKELYECYFSKDEVVRLRVSNAMKRITKEHPDWVAPYLDKFISEISKINQASTQWTLSQLFLSLQDEMSDKQKTFATKIMLNNLKKSDDWIVLAQTVNTLGEWAKKDENLKKYLKPLLQKISKDSRKAVANKAKKILDTLEKS